MATKLTPHERLVRLVRAYRHARRRERSAKSALRICIPHQNAWVQTAKRHERFFFAADLCASIYYETLHTIGGER